MELLWRSELGREAESGPLRLHHPHWWLTIACGRGVGRLEKRVNVCEVDAKKCCCVGI